MKKIALSLLLIAVMPAQAGWWSGLYQAANDNPSPLVGGVLIGAGVGAMCLALSDGFWKSKPTLKIPKTLITRPGDGVQISKAVPDHLNRTNQGTVFDAHNTRTRVCTMGISTLCIIGGGAVLFFNPFKK